MDTQIKLPETFSDLLSIFQGKNVGVCCIKGKKVYFGTLTDVAKKSIAIKEKGVLKTIPLCHVSSLSLTKEDNFSPDSVFAETDSELFNKYKQFVEKNVTVRRKDNLPWDETGIIKHIGKDYIVVLNDYDKVLNYMYANVEWDMIPR